jgi:hypothetical protein
MRTSGPQPSAGGPSVALSRRLSGAQLPDSLPPRGLSRVLAAQYIGVSPSHFDKLIRDRVMPPPKRLGSRVVWDRKQCRNVRICETHGGNLVSHMQARQSVFKLRSSASFAVPSFWKSSCEPS